jgi:hypothetical protein
MNLVNNRYSSQWRIDNGFSKQRTFIIEGPSTYKDLGVDLDASPGQRGSEQELKTAIKDTITQCQNEIKNVRRGQLPIGLQKKDAEDYARLLEKALEKVRQWKVVPAFGG